MNRKVLIIEDDKNFAESLKNIFIDKQFEVKVSFSVQQAEQFITLEKYDLIVVDLVLPKVNGLEFLKKILSKGVLHSQCKIWLISGVLKEKIVSKNIISHVDKFITKPINRHSIEKQIDKLFVRQGRILKTLPFFYLNLPGDHKDNKSNALNNKEYFIKSHELLFICFYLNSLGFDGVLTVTHSEGELKDEILFKNGNIVSFTFKDNVSYIGSLLVKHQYVSQKIVDQFLKEDTDQPLGERLIAHCYISPHQLNKVLREQLAIKLFKVMGDHSLKISCQEHISSSVFEQYISLDFKDLLSLVDNWIYSKVEIQWLIEFFNNNKDMYVVSIKSSPALKQLSRYSKLKTLYFEQPQEKKKVSEILNTSGGEKKQIMRGLYCRLLIKESVFEYWESGSLDNQGNYSFLKKKYQSLLIDANSKNYFELLNLPTNASISQINEVYKIMVKIFHPDRRDKNMPPDLIKIYDQCFTLVQNIYHCLTDPVEKNKYIQSIEQKAKEDKFTVKTQYMEGKKLLNDGLYDQAFDHFKDIFQSKLVPGDVILYYIWAYLKSNKCKGNTLNSEQKKELKKLFDSVGFEYNQTGLFYFAQGLFMKATENFGDAFEYFKKAVLLDSRLIAARVEKYSLKKKRKPGIKKSLMDLFKKGA